MEFMRGTTGYTGLDYEKNLDVMKELNIQPIMEFIDNYRHNWKTHVLRVPHSFPFKIIRFQPEERGSLGRPFTRWHEAITGRWA